ncbi:hypothetical protein [Halarcobacter anaerophilus]|uniref:Uncharacterized protein n=1 Tax=Halarcobacter anaerophilus TaxID=877500 RepID=A0A4Q0Y495_9BACT|nr:hypothetical protein [Halarcobacter anaerophilus]QDF30033.1 hypothetical protein AANAER_2587 [Halarcobacter anaerophilus]RXJ63081.1 hypothetical protein CRV06_07415 [Halarcobacter anaerophilus]
MVEILLVFTNCCILLIIFKEVYKLKKEIYHLNFQKREQTNELFEKFKNRLYVISAISSSIETNLEFDKLDRNKLLNSLEDISTNIKNVESDIRVLEKELFH